MSFTPNLSTTLLLLTVIVVLLPIETYAFGAGDIPDFAYLNDKAFRHGDIESILETLVKSVGGAAAGGGILGFAQSVITKASGGAKFSKSDIKKVYFGNWLRDYSQAMDIAGLSKLSADTLVLVVSILGFMTFGFATEEFQVTADRLGVYLPVEHIDNPKGYAAKEGDAREFHPKLRPPVDDRELEIDERTGMKNYMATEDQGWDSSTAFIRRTFRACIEHGRRASGQDGAELWEAYRLLGTGLHTLEDLLAHSNWCEVALRKMGHEEVFCHVGDNIIINTPSGPAPPLITGSFGGADFIHSLMGEATDKLSQASVTDLSQKMDQASKDEGVDVAKLKEILGQLPIGGGDEKMDQGEQIHEQAKAYHFDPDNVAPPEVQQQMLSLLKWRDDVYRDVLKRIEMVPGLEDLLEQLTNALNAYVYTVLSPYVAPILQQATGVLGEGSKAVIDSEDQFEVFNNPNASDPTHSFLSKDHFDLILNEPAGKIAQIVVEHSVNLIVRAWADDSNPDDVITEILEAFHHPYYATGQSNIQNQMYGFMERWIGGMGYEDVQTIIQSLTKDSVRNGKNKRPGSENESHDEAGYGGHSHGGATYRPAIGSGGGGRQDQQGQYGGSGTETSYGGNTDSYSANQRQEYGSGNTYGAGRRSDNDYPSGRAAYGEPEHTSSQYGQSQASYGRGEDNSGNAYGSGGGRNTYGASQEEGHGARRSDNEYSSGRTAYGESERTHASAHSNSYGQDSHSRRDDDAENTYGSHKGRTNYGESQEEEHGSGRHGGDQGEGYGGRQERSSEYQSSGYQPSYNQPSSTYSSAGRGGDEYGSSGHGGGRRTEEASGYNRGGNESGSSGYNRGGDDDHHGSHRERHEQPSGYGGQSGYAPSYGDNDETYGAERLNIGRRDDDDDDNRHHGGHHGKNRNRSDEY
ncbi:hypothetical protein Hypma_015984 [Hypsizygus marmoreus]|uniref:Het-C-domain-containing protein n=1 Tax=Hypsizygus marmoreus TaxID=39966 RepID=A0A369KCW4_HYPMA|nr:hypothetical protein Hypma_015984 [Hypsizygus marmoreus]